MALSTVNRALPVRTAHDLFAEFDRAFRAVPSASAATAEALARPIDLFETGEALVLEMAVPGLRAEDLEIDLEGRKLSIRGAVGDEAAEDRRYWLQGIPRGDFRRSLTLPVRVDADAVEASLRDGVLRLVLPKASEAKARRIEVAAS